MCETVRQTISSSSRLVCRQSCTILGAVTYLSLVSCTLYNLAIPSVTFLRLQNCGMTNVGLEILAAALRRIDDLQIDHHLAAGAEAVYFCHPNCSVTIADRPPPLVDLPPEILEIEIVDMDADAGYDTNDAQGPPQE